MDYRGATVIADYGPQRRRHEGPGGAVAAMPANKRVVVISGAGDRRDEDLASKLRSSATP